MSSILSFEVPVCLANLVTRPAIEQYTVSDPDHDIHSKIAALTINELFPNDVKDRKMAQCCLSGIWLLHNFLDESHDISQSLETREGSYWHGIMHRLEGDFWNSKYWYRNVGLHPAFDSIQQRMEEDETWNPDHFVDQCEAAQRDSSLQESVQRIAAAEWQSLFEYCYENAS